MDYQNSSKRLRLVGLGILCLAVGGLLVKQHAEISGLRLDRERLSQLINDQQTHQQSLIDKSTAMERDLQRHREQVTELARMRAVVAQLSQENSELLDRIQSLERTTRLWNRSAFREGKIVKTGKPLDIAISGDGFFEVQLPDGRPAYTREGAFQLSSDGRVVAAHGLPVNGFPLLTDVKDLSFSTNGEVTIATPNGVRMFRLQLHRFAYPKELAPIGMNMFSVTPKSGAPELGKPSENDFGYILQHHLEVWE